MIYWKSTEAKTRYRFPEEGEYTLQIRDITFRHGEPGFRYRVLIRTEIPHVGEIQVIEYWENRNDVEIDRVNLRPGEVKKLTLISDREEGFTGDLVVTAENLPVGVRTLPGTQVEQPRGVVQDEGLKERFQADRRETVLSLLAEEDAPATTLPHPMRVLVRPVVEDRKARYVKYTGTEGWFPIHLGKASIGLFVKEIPVMVSRPSGPSPTPSDLQARRIIQE